MNDHQLQLKHLGRKTKAFAQIADSVSPPNGWIKTVRLSMGMTLQQLANKLSITKQSVLELERREAQGNITLKSLKEAANALDMQVVYGLVPKDGSIEALIDRKALELATKIVLRTSNTMILEDQGISKSRLNEAIIERAKIIKTELPKMLWD